jgi:dipeptidase
MVIDGAEGWIFQILPDDTGPSAIWAAARVPDDHVGIVANMFTIRDLDPSDSKNFAFSSNVHSIAQKKGWWKPSDGLLDFTAVYSDGEYAHKFYSGRRMWGGYRMLAPSVSLPDNYTDLRYDAVYPTFLKPDKKIEVADLLAVHRTFYEGTKYDMTKGVAAGPFGNPDRFKTQGITKVAGAWERSIGLFRTSQAHVLQARSFLPKDQSGVIWFGPHAAHGSCFVPFTVGMTALPRTHSNADPRAIDRSSAYWAHKYTLQVAHLRYSSMMADISDLRTVLVKRQVALLKELDKKSQQVKFHDGHERREFLRDATEKLVGNAEDVTKSWWTLPDLLIFRYADGFYNNSQPLAYSDAWLTDKEVGYVTGPPPPPKEPNMEMV